ncbi:MAG: hypothetical protein D6690_02290 [Nitrospirae bacterium]|nr:MAG: hypothetical protein D6690_02290 [Nitrospirota bacterium]
MWAAILELGARQEPFRCVYSNAVLTPERFASDHVIPWAFVAHDQPWYLLPVLLEVNAAKSHAAPHPRYIPGLAVRQAKALDS